jgi:glycine cleavage system H protein
MLKFTPDHEWLLIENDFATVGITQFAQEQLGDLVFVELPKLGAMLQPGGIAAVVESVKAASEVYAPIGGEVIEVNARVSEDPTLVNSDPTGTGWLFKLMIADKTQLDSLMDEPAYRTLIAGLERFPGRLNLGVFSGRREYDSSFLLGGGSMEWRSHIRKTCAPVWWRRLKLGRPDRKLRTSIV